MGCDIHTHYEKKNSDGKWVHVKIEYGQVDYFDNRNYEFFAFIAGIQRRDSTEDDNNVIYDIPALKKPTYTIPKDSCPEIRFEYEEWGVDGHSATFYTLAELLNFNYDNIMPLSHDPNPAKGVLESIKDVDKSFYLTYRKFLGPEYFKDLKKIKKHCKEKDPENIRLVIWFDN